MERAEAACGCRIGKVRGNNEDNFCFCRKLLPPENRGLPGILTWSGELDGPVCFGVFDGMGGAAWGERAAYLAARTMSEAPERPAELPEALLAICREANLAICREARRRGAGCMGSTAVLLGLDGDAAHLVNVGDSRGYLWRAGALRQISVDHTDRFLLAGQAPLRHRPRLTQHLGIEPSEMILEPHTAEIALKRGDVFLLCSDGLTDMVDGTEIARLLRAAAPVSDRLESLLHCALARGGRDNVTAVLCEVS